MEQADPGAKNADMVDKVCMVCKVCGGEVDYDIENSCPFCGFISIECKRCGYQYHFGE